MTVKCTKQDEIPSERKRKWQSCDNDTSAEDNKRRQRQHGQNYKKKSQEKDTLILDKYFLIIIFYFIFHLWTLLKKECSRFIVFLKCVMHRNIEYPELEGSSIPAGPAPSMLSPFPSPPSTPVPWGTTSPQNPTRAHRTCKVWLLFPFYTVCHNWKKCGWLHCTWSGPLSSCKFHRPSYINLLPLLILNKRHWFEIYSQKS